MNKKIIFLVLLAVVFCLPFAVFATSQIDDTISALTTTAKAVGASIAVIGWVIAGTLYLTAAGGSRMETAKKAMIAAVIGTVLVILASSEATLTAFVKGVFGIK